MLEIKLTLKKAIGLTMHKNPAAGKTTYRFADFILEKRVHGQETPCLTRKLLRNNKDHCILYGLPQTDIRGLPINTTTIRT